MAKADIDVVIGALSDAIAWNCRAAFSKLVPTLADK
jgi:hypothetical protein